jgi:hypothetical protein
MSERWEFKKMRQKTMIVLPLLITKTVRSLIRSVREMAYDDMARQASDWIPEEARIETTIRETQPIKLDFAVPKRNRLAWIRRTIQHLPH